MLIPDEEIQTLDYQSKNGLFHHFRLRCQGILLSNEGVSVSEIARRLNKDLDTIYSWINRYDSGGIFNLKNRKGQGQKATLSGLSKE